jgi:multidrug efflux system outer membrane protein
MQVGTFVSRWQSKRRSVVVKGRARSYLPRHVILSGDSLTAPTHEIMRPVAIIAAGLACFALGACATARTPETRLPAAYEAAHPGSTALSPAVLDTWWTQFQDPDLTALIEQALKQAPDARAAAARLAEAQATASEGLLAFLPQGNAVGQTKETHTTQTSGKAIAVPGFSTSGKTIANSGNLNVSWEVDLFGRIFAVSKAAKGDAATARFDYEATRASLAANVADTYFQVRGLAIQLADARETVRVERDLQRVADVKSSHGLAATSDSDRVAGDLAQAESQATSLEAELQAARRTLLVLVGRGVDPTSTAPVTVNVGVLPDVPATVPGALLARRPDVREAEARIWSAVGRESYDQLAFFPTLDLQPGIGLAKSKQPGLSVGTRSWSIGGTITQPVLSIPKMLAELKAQNARTEQAVIAYEKAVQTAYGEVDSALVRLDSDKRRVALLTDGERRAARAYQASRTGYGAGYTDLQTALSAEQSWRAVRSQLTTAQVQALRRVVQSYKAMGGGWAVLPAKQEARNK